MRLSIFFLFVALGLFLVIDPAFAETAAEEASSAGGWSFMKAFAPGLTIALASSVGALAQSRVGVAALEGIGRNPGAAGQMFTPMLLALVLIVSLVIYALVIAFLLPK